MFLKTYIRHSTVILIGSVLSVFSMLTVSASDRLDDVFDMPILVVGASYDNGNTPLSDDLQGPLGGGAVNFGSYLSIGAALVGTPLTRGFVINEARGGAGTFDRPSCTLDACASPIWISFANQFEKALLRVAIPNLDNPTEIAGYNARYVMIGIPNDCLHSNAAGVPQTQSQQCTTADINTTVDNIKAVGERALSLGITPVIYGYPKYEDLDLALSQTLFGFVWVIDAQRYNELRDTHRSRLQAELSDVVFVENALIPFNLISDGLHPDSRTAERAARKIARKIRQHARQQMGGQP